jgi:GEVED domain/CARDB/Secretion system C-terminal sorting domain/Domain of unknown function DUF11
MHCFYKSRFYQTFIHGCCTLAIFFFTQSALRAQALPDLTLGNVVINLSSIIPNQTLNYSLDLKNIGTAASTVLFGYQTYLSTDNVLSDNDINAGIFPPATAALVPAGFSTRFGLYYIPPTTVPSGTYFIIVKVDPANNVKESNENNNVAVSTTTFTILPNPPAADLTLGNLNVSTPSVLASQNINYKVDLKNLGRGTPTDFIVNAYLSTDNVLTNTDPRIGGFAATSMGPAQVITQLPASATVPATFAAGQYYLILKIDANTQINELDEDNNVLASTTPITVTRTTTSGGTYCASKSAAPWEMWIEKVYWGSTGIINNTSKQFKDINTAGYSDFTNISATVAKGQTYFFEITANASWGGNFPNTFCRVWIDFNKNGVFEDSEKTFEQSGNNLMSGYMPIPTSAAVGAVRMRVAVKFGSYPTQCEAFAKGEVEDYTLNITGSTSTTCSIQVDSIEKKCVPNATTPTWQFRMKLKAQNASLSWQSVPTPPSTASFGVDYGTFTTLGDYNFRDTFKVVVVDGLNRACSLAITVPPPPISACGTVTGVQMSIRSSSPTYQPYSLLSYTVEAKNTSAIPLTNINVLFPFPAKTANGGAVTTSLGTWHEWCAGSVQCFTWTIPSLAPNATATLTVPIYIVDATAPLVATAKILTSTPTTTSNIATITVNRVSAAQAVSQALTFRVPTQLIPVVIQRISPNPTMGDVQIKLDSWTKQTVDVNFSDITGKIIYSEPRDVEKGVNRLDFEVFHLPQGVYFIQTNVGKGKDVPTKFVKM